MDANLVYWTVALGNLGVIVAFAMLGIQQIRRDEIVRHRRSMLTSGILVIAFLISYPIKLLILGREPLELWGSGSVLALRIHECFVLLMVVAGVFALRRVWKLRRLMSLPPRPEGNTPRLPGLDRHRRAGRLAFVGAALGFVTAAFVLAGMYQRLPPNADPGIPDPRASVSQQEAPAAP